LGRTGAAEWLVHSSKYLAGSNNSGGAIAEPAGRLQRQSLITGGAAMTMQSDISVETADAEDLWWDDADAEENRLRKVGAKACSRLLALLQQHHEYATGELELRTRKRAA
jgi:hypothetical protein